MLFDNLYPSLPQVRDGKLRGLAVTTTERSFQAPEIPTLRESAPELTNFEVSSWFGVFLPAGAPPAVVNAYNTEIKAFLDKPDVQARIREFGAQPDPTTPTQYAAFVRAEIEKFGVIIRRRICRWT